MIHTNQWQPDTCGCVLEYTWDDAENQSTRVHTPTRIVKACPAHISMGKDAHYSKVLDENQRKNKAHGLILESMPELVDEVVLDDGSKVKKLKNGIEFKFAFDANRKLQISLTGITSKHKTDIQALVQAKLGSSKIDIL